MHINLFNSSNPNGKCIPVTITLKQVDDINTHDGEVIYTILLATGAIDRNKKRVDNVFLNNVSETSVMGELNRGLSIIGKQIDWGVLEEDIHPPIITDIFPLNNSQNVPINSNVSIDLKDPFPASFIDLSTLKLKVNGIDVSNQLVIKENNTDIKLTWVPVKVLN